MSKTNSAVSDPRSLEIVGADANNLQDIDCEFPLTGLSAVVGVSGSGKSSLLQDVIAAETSKRNILFHGGPRHGVAERAVRAYVGPTPPSLFVGQRPFRPSTRTTVGTATGLIADLRHLFLAEGAPHTSTRQEVPPPTPASYAAWLTRHYRGRVTVWVAPVRWTRSDGVAAATRLLNAGIKQGILRTEGDGPEALETSREIDLTQWRPQPEGRLYALEAQVGTIMVDGPGSATTLENLLGEAWSLSAPDVMVELLDAPDDLTVGPWGPILDAARHHLHPDDAHIFRAPNRHLLSFNAPEHLDSGACRHCKGIGHHREVRLDVLIPDASKSMHQGALALWTDKNYKHLNVQHHTIEGLRGRAGFDPDVPWKDLPRAAQDLILDGAGDEPVQGLDPKTRKKQGAPKKFEGFRTTILRRAVTATGAKPLANFVKSGPCPYCDGTRWSPEARALWAAGRPLHDWLSLPFTKLADACCTAMDAARTDPGRQALERMANRSRMLTDLGLGHLSGDRGMQTVSDGESRRLQIGATLAASSGDLMLLLDEPARGLHEIDLDPMISVLRSLAERHCVVLNEHRAPIVRAADHVVTLGPGAGPDGGRIISMGRSWQTDEVTPVLVPGPKPERWIHISGATMHNVQNQDVRVPLGVISAIVGVSGSGKSSFARGVLIPALLTSGKICGDAPDAEDALKGKWTAVEGLGAVRRVHVLHQRVPPRNARSLVATMTGAFDEIAEAFAGTDQAQQAGMAMKDFRLNSGTGRCSACLGTGTAAATGDEVAPCATCGGSRYGKVALSARVAGLDMAETLRRPVSQLLDIWNAQGRTDLSAKLGPLFQTMQELGLGHVALGRRVDSLSGGEIQRLRVALTLAGDDDRGGHLFFLDEPAAGLHDEDAGRLMHVFRRMIADGRNTVVIIEHNMHVVRDVDWLIEFGPGAGPDGGWVLAEGAPQEVALQDTPTGCVLGGRSWLEHQPRFSSPILGWDRSAEILERIVTGDLDAGSARDAAAEARYVTGRRVWEIGDLDLEVGRLLLDDWQTQVHEATQEFLDIWRHAPGCKVQVAPLLPEMRIWGSVLPRSAAKAAQERMRQIGLAPRHEDLETLRLGPGAVRAAVPPPDVGGDAARLAALDLAFAIGGGFAELIDENGEVRAQAKTTPLDLATGRVGPQVLSLGHLSRLHPEGACPCCGGAGTIIVTRPDLLVDVAAKVSPLDTEACLTPEASALLKGVWRAEARPFFRRLHEEGLAEVHDLRQVLLFGFWHRPGHGSFLKSSKDDPAEVASWLRWDGLMCRIWPELARSKRKQWAKDVEGGRHRAPCPECRGTGHGVAAALMRLHGRPLAEWIAEEQVSTFRRAIMSLPISRKRQEPIKRRILACLDAASGSLTGPAERQLALVDAVRHAFVVERH